MKRSLKKKGGKKVLSKLGKANPLSGDLWWKWLQHVQKELGAKYYWILYLTQVLCLRITQVLKLKAEDFDFRSSKIWVAAFKRKPGVWKPLVHSVKQTISKWKSNKVQKSKKYKFETKGYLFPSRTGAKVPHMTKDVLAHAIKRIEQQFREVYKAGAKAIRTHSGRRHNISLIASTGASDSVGMAWSQISSHRIYRGYIDISPEDVRHELEAIDKRRGLGQAKLKQHSS